MGIVYNFYFFTLIISCIIALIVAFMAQKRTPVRGAAPMVILMLSIFIWCIFQALAFIVSDIDLKVNLSNFKYFGIEIAPISFYALAYSYKSKVKDLPLKKWLQFLVFPFFVIMFLWTNPLHHIFYEQVYLENNILILKSGTLFWINMGYLYVFILIAVYRFIREYIKASSIYKGQSLILMLSAFIPILANIAFNFNMLPFFKDIDMTPFSFLITGILYFYAFFQYKLIDIVPVARDLVVEEMEDMVMVIDNNNRVLDMNKKARENILAGTKDTYVGEELATILTRWKELKDVIFHSTDKNIKINYNSNSKTEYYDLRVSTIYDEKGRKNGEIIVLVDITDLEKAFLEAKSSKAEADYANKAKSDFLANMSHEIRTPMNAVIGIAEILNTTELSREQQKEYIRMIVNSAEALLTIINDILDFSKIEAGKLELENSELNLRNVINDTVESLSVLAKNKGIEIRADIDELQDLKLLGDAVRIRQIILNLLSNALKFTKYGEIRVSAKPSQIEEKQIVVEIKVVDTGVGIPKEKIESIFESFKQVDNSTTRKFGGTGLGLSIVKNLVGLMKGNITVESELGKGSTFCCNIPFDISDSMNDDLKKSEVEKEEIKELPGLTILVAEDNKINRQIINTYLKKLACKVDFAENGAEVIEKYEQNIYDVILMDVQMPVMDGLAATREIRKKEKEKHIPIIALTASVLKEDIDNCKEAGMDNHLAKPIKIDILYNTLKAFIH